MLRRKAYQHLLDWKTQSAGRSAVLLEGARRVGKSFLAEHFGRNEYKSYLLVDFTIAPDEVREYFTDMRDDLDAFFLYLSAFYGVKLYERDTLIIFDEVQAFPKAREAIKQLVADGRYDYIETGSLMSIRENVADILIPSEEHAIALDPLDFDEFLWALDQEPLTRAIAQSFADLKPLPDSLHRKASRLFREFMLVGGMPQAVDTYATNRDLAAVDMVKQDILRLYRNDIAKTATPVVRRRITAVFDDIPSQLSKPRKIFTLASLGEQARMREYEDSFFWLSDAHVTNACFNATDPHVGLAMSEDRALVKMYMADTGLLVSHAFTHKGQVPADVYRDILLGKLELNEGMLVENAVAQLLHASGHRLFFYYRSSDRAADRMEVDFVIQHSYASTAGRLRVSPIEVKSTKTYTTSSLLKFKHKFASRVGTQYVIHPSPLKKDGDLVYLPLYMTGQL